MDVEVVPAALRSRLGAEGTAGLVECLDRAGREWKDEVVTLAVERFERRLTEEISGLRAEMRDGDAALRVEMHEGAAALRVEMHQSLGGLRVEMHDLIGGVRQEIATTRVELIRWSFVFWVGQTIATAGLVVALVKLLLP